MWLIVTWLFLKKQCQDFATALLDHTRSSYELEVMLNYDPEGPAYTVSQTTTVAVQFLYKNQMDFSETNT